MARGTSQVSFKYFFNLHTQANKLIHCLLLNRWLVPADKRLDEQARKRYDGQPNVERAQWHIDAPVAPEETGSATKAKTKSKRVEYVDLPHGNKVFFLIDCETTGSKRNWDRGISYCIIAYDRDGKMLGSFSSLVSNDGVRIKPAAYNVHKISYNDLKGAPSFRQVGTRINAFFSRLLQQYDAGVLVAHNGATDFQFLCCDYQRADLVLPPKLKHTICTLQCLRRFGALAYRKAKPEEWSVLTKSGKPSMNITSCSTFTLQKRMPPSTFEETCGRHHDAEADVRGVAVIMFDYKELGDTGLYHKIFHSKRKVCVMLNTIWDEMVIKLQSPIIKIEPLPRGWIGCAGDEEGIKSSGYKVPDEVQQVPEPVFDSRRQRGEGKASPALNKHLRETGHFNRRKWTGSARDLIWFLFLFFFPLWLLAKIARWTTLKATELVLKTTTVVNGKMKKKVTRFDSNSSFADLRRGKPRLSRWKYDLTVGELIVWIGIRVRMGLLNKKRSSHYWSPLPGVGDPVIRQAMLQERFNMITSALSFAPLGTKSGWAKFSYVDQAVRAACRLAVGITQHLAIDESMIKCYSRYCRWKQFMPRKPIKTGIKVFALVLSTGFLFDWHLFRGANDPLSGKHSMYTLINDILLGDTIFDNVGCIVFCDAAFTSIKLFSQLCSRGIFAVGPMNAKKPDKGGNSNSWPHQDFKNGDTEYLARGWDRTVFAELPCGGWIQATVWRDNKFVKLLNTVYILDGVDTVTRWIKSAADYVTVSARVVLKMYQRHMGHVDRVDKNVSLSGIRLRRCKNRYHRQIFLWLIAAVAVNNVFILFLMLYPLATELQQQSEKNGFGFKHFFQHELSSVLIERGIQMCNVNRRNKAAATLINFYRSGDWKASWRYVRSTRLHRSRSTPSSALSDNTSDASGNKRGPGRPRKKKRGSGGGRNKRARTISTPPPKQLTRKEKKVRRQMQRRLDCFEFQSPPPFQPKSRGRKRKGSDGFTIYVGGRKHTLVHSSTLGLWKSSKGRCACCFAMAPPVKGHREYMADGSYITSTNFACNVCKKRLCPECHHNTWTPHFENTSLPREIVFSSRSLVF